MAFGMLHYRDRHLVRRREAAPARCLDVHRYLVQVAVAVGWNRRPAQRARAGSERVAQHADLADAPIGLLQIRLDSPPQLDGLAPRDRLGGGQGHGLGCRVRSHRDGFRVIRVRLLRTGLRVRTHLDVVGLPVFQAAQVIGARVRPELHKLVVELHLVS